MSKQINVYFERYRVFNSPLTPEKVTEISDHCQYLTKVRIPHKKKYQRTKRREIYIFPERIHDENEGVAYMVEDWSGLELTGQTFLGRKNFTFEDVKKLIK